MRTLGENVFTDVLWRFGACRFDISGTSWELDNPLIRNALWRNFDRMSSLSAPLAASPSRGRPRSEKARVAALDAACDLFEEGGYPARHGAPHE
jgi:hypothetical protein